MNSRDLNGFNEMHEPSNRTRASFAATCRPNTRSTPARLSYFGGSEGRPFNFMYEPPADVERENCTFDICNVDICNARLLSEQPSIHREGFELHDAKSSVNDFFDTDQIRRTYYAECVDLACSVTGGSSAIVFDHLIRKREAGRPALTFGRAGNGSKPGSVGRVHNDYTEDSGRRRLGLVVRDDYLAARVRRYCIVNIWRSVGGPILDTPLAVCDARTVMAQDMVVSEIRYPDRVGEIYLFKHAKQHRWSYYPMMDRDEALIFKQFDSAISGVARFTPHAAFDLPNIPNDAPLRQSIEVRCLVFFD